MSTQRHALGDRTATGRAGFAPPRVAHAVAEELLPAPGAGPAVAAPRTLAAVPAVPAPGSLPAPGGRRAPGHAGAPLPAAGTWRGPSVRAARDTALRAARVLTDGSGWALACAALDVLALTAAVLVVTGFSGGRVDPGVTPWLAAFPWFGLAALAVRGAYGRRLRPTALEDVGTLAGAVAGAAMAVALSGTYAGAALLPLAALAELWLVAVVALVGARALGLGARRRLRAHGVVAPALVVGAGAVGTKIARRLRLDPGYGLRAVGFLDADPPPAEAVDRTLPVLGTPDDLERVAALTGARHVVVAFSAVADSRLSPLVQRCERAGLGVSVVPRFFDAMNGRLAYDTLGGIPLLGLQVTDPRGWRFAVKHAFDRVVAGALLLALAPLMLLLAAAVRLSSPGPVLFRQRRVGRDGRVFSVLKFRSMAGAEGDDDFTPDDGSAPGGVEGTDRRTLVGRVLRRTSLDELPQLLNVLRGDMSLVGPRPERPEFVERFESDIERYGDRHRVRAGITGWAQVHGLRGQTSIADRAEWDNFYIEHWTLGLDLKILLLTLVAVFRHAE
jgi:exopolysaccharide biosynthesis polyprenyl glycosylphosphotransferase